VAATRKSKQQKLLQDTFKKSREEARKKPANPEEELADCREALEAMKQNLRLATADIAQRGLLVETAVTDSHGKVSTVDRINPSIKIQREAMRAISNLKKQIAGLEEEEKAREEEKKRAEGRSEFSRFEMAPDENEFKMH
jgi:hypothetical protein